MLEPGDRRPRALLRGHAGPPRVRLARLGLALLPDTQVFRRRRPAPPPRSGRALASFSDLRSGDYVVHEDHGDRPPARVRDARGGRGHPRLPAARVPGRRPRLRSARADRQGLPLHRGRVEPAGALQARRQAPGTTSRTAPAPTCARWPASCSRSTPSARRGPGIAYDVERRVAAAARGRLPLPRDRGPGARDRGGQGGSRGAAPDGPARLRRRRLREDGGGAAAAPSRSRRRPGRC